jgi:hypothetical protein
VTLGLCTSCFFPSVYQNGGNTERNWDKQAQMLCTC